MLSFIGTFILIILGMTFTQIHFAQAQLQPWSSWESLGGYSTGDPLGAKYTDTRSSNPTWGSPTETIFVPGGADWASETANKSGGHSVWYKQPQVSNNWFPLGGYVTSEIAVARNIDNRIVVFSAGGNHSLFQIYQQPNSMNWSSWESLGGYTTTDPSVGMFKDG